MKRLDGIELGALIVLLAGIVLALMHWQSVQRMFGYVLHEPTRVVRASAPAAPAPGAGASGPVAQASAPAVLQLPAASQPLPALARSDSAFGRVVAGLVGRRDFARWWVPDQLILHLVSTVDNLGRDAAPVRAWPVRPARGRLQVRADGKGWRIAESNSARYASYVAWTRSVEPARAVEAYLAFYPLFQQAWRELGHPEGAFNDRLLQVIDNLLAAPEPVEPPRLVQPHVLYEYADPGLQSASAGQKLLMRIGPENERDVKAWLRELRAQLLRHMGDASGTARTQR